MSVTIYSTSLCSACKTLESWLNSKGIVYEKKVVDTDAKLMIEFMAVNDGNIGVPFTVVSEDDGTIRKIAGYDPKKLKEIFNKE